MDETEALCTKIGIMVNGELKCNGSLQHLKNTYGNGYHLLVKVSNNESKSNSQDFIEFILNFMENTELVENREGYLNFHIANNSSNILSLIFSAIEVNRLKFSIEYYVITQTNLEQIFLNFASKQIDYKSRFLEKKSN